MTMTPIKFSMTPSRIISVIERYPLLKTIALGAVATGSIKAQLALIAAGTINKLGSSPAAIAAGARIGINKNVVAVLLVVSVRKVTIKAIKTMITSGCKFASTVN